ncbi:hypothetical protein [Burkholderia stagnalis]|uniref:hypothetical protein n=1 Tax=Burkholderia stagnalis TaxID=1503054 RepID=UPI000F802E6A|nr:hypothetical protein [Burkholderia stagnalis]
MQREVARSKKLPAFSIGIGGLEVLFNRLSALFDKDKKIYGSINITLKSEVLTFDNVDELKQYSGSLGRVTNFSIRLSQDGRRVSIRSASIGSSRAEVITYAESEAWCAGAIETVYAYMSSNRLWYDWFLSAPLGWLLIIMVNIPTVAQLVFPKGQLISKTVVAGWVAMTAVMTVLFFSKGKLLPASILVFNGTDNFIRRYAAELSLLVAIISVVLTVVGWFVAK